MSGVTNTVSRKGKGDDIVFLRKIIKGGRTRVRNQVAKLAGVRIR